MASIAPINDSVDVGRLPTPYQEARVSPQALGAGMGDLADRAAQIISGIQHKAKDEADTTAVISAMGAAQDAYNGLILDHKTGYSALRGEQAIAARDDAIKKYDQVLSKISGSLANPEQKNAFGRHALVFQERARNHVESHFAQQAEVFATTQFEGTVQSYLRVLAQPGVVDKPAERDKQFVEVSRVAAAEAARRGENPALLVGKAQDLATRTMLDNLLAGKNPNVIEAAQVLGKYGDRLGDDRAKYQKVLQDVSDAREADTKAIEITKKSLGRDGQVDRRKAQGLIDELPGGALKDKVQQGVDHRANVFDAAWKDEATNLAAGVVDAMQDPQTGEFNLSNVPQSLMSALELKWPTKAAALKKGASIKNAKQHYAEAVEQFFGPEGWQDTARMTRQAFVTDDAILALPAKHRAALTERFNALQKRLDRPPAESIVVEESRRILGLGKTGKIGSLSDEKKAAFADLYDAVKTDVREWAIVHQGQPADREEVRKMVRDNLGIVSSGWFSPTVRTYQSRKTAPKATAPVTQSGAGLPPLSQSPAAKVPLYRYSPEGTKRVPVDENGEATGPIEDVTP